MKTLTDFRKTLETGVDQHVKFSHIAVHISFTRENS